MNDPQVTVDHVRACRLCTRGARAWFKKHGLNYGTFLRAGYPASVLEKTGDGFALTVVGKAREMQGKM